MKSRWMGPLIQEICGESISLGESVVKIRVSVPSFSSPTGVGKWSSNREIQAVQGDGIVQRPTQAGKGLMCQIPV